MRKQIRHRSKRVRLDPPEIAEEAARLAARNGHDPEFPLRLIGLRELRSHNSWMHNAPLLMRGGRTHAARIHPDDAEGLGIADGERGPDQLAPRLDRDRGDAHRRGQARARSRSRTAGATAVAGRSPTPPGGANVNQLASSDPADLERLAGMAHLNGIPVRLEAVDLPAGDGEAAVEYAPSA